MNVLPGLIRGASFLFIAEGLNAVEPNGVTFARIAVGFVTLSLFPSARQPVARSDWAGIAGVGVLWLAFPLSMFPFAEQHVSSALTGMLNGATPLFVAAIAALLAHALPSRGVMTGLAVGFAGAVVMALPGLGGSSSAFGIMLIVFALLSYGIALNLARPLQQRNGAIPVMWRALGVAMVLTAPLGLPAVLNGHWTLRGPDGRDQGIDRGILHHGRRTASRRRDPPRAGDDPVVDWCGDLPARRRNRPQSADDGQLALPRDRDHPRTVAGVQALNPRRGVGVVRRVGHAGCDERVSPLAALAAQPAVNP